MNKVADVAVAIVGVALIFVLTRPGSQGPSIVKAIGNSFSGAIQSATTGKGPY
jgi:hypothetical protein